MTADAPMTERTNTDLATVDRRRFLRGTAFALALPWFESLAAAWPASKDGAKHRRFACAYYPDGVPMPLAEDPAYEEWSWFPHGSGKEFRFTKCLEPLEPLRDQLTVFSGLSHPLVRNVHGHSNADQFLTGGPTGAKGEYRNTISLDQVITAQFGEAPRHDSLVLSTDGGAGTPRGARTLSFSRAGRALRAGRRPGRVVGSVSGAASDVAETSRDVE